VLGEQDLLVAVRIESEFVGILSNHYTVPFYGIIIQVQDVFLWLFGKFYGQGIP
jgi:hypothetical protein